MLLCRKRFVIMVKDVVVLKTIYDNGKAANSCMSQLFFKRQRMMALFKIQNLIMLRGQRLLTILPYGPLD